MDLPLDHSDPATNSPAVTVEEFRPVVRNSLRGFVRVRLPSGMILHDVTLHSQAGKTWASPPGRPQVGADGAQMRDPDGKLLYVPTVTFATSADRAVFSRAVVAAVSARDPEALA
jgi:hypothetical protein